MQDHDNDHIEMWDVDAITEPTCADELAELVGLADRAIVALTGPSFPYLAPTDAAHALMVAAVLMPEHLRLRTMSLGVSLLHTEDWDGGLGVATRHGDPLARVIHEYRAVCRPGRLAAEPLIAGG